MRFDEKVAPHVREDRVTAAVAGAIVFMATFAFGLPVLFWIALAVNSIAIVAGIHGHEKPGGKLALMLATPVWLNSMLILWIIEICGSVNEGSME